MPASIGVIFQHLVVRMRNAEEPINTLHRPPDRFTQLMAQAAQRIGADF